ncbi:hypothetical protein KQH54_00125 [bacterium]|nr:hypothetical protein [bacterium]
MSDLFDRLQNELDNRNEEGGISPMDLLDLPDALRKIMRKMLRSRTMRKAEIHAFMETWDKKEKLSPKELEEALAALVAQGWLIILGEGENLGYRVNLRKKKGSTLNDNIWGAIDSRLGGAKKDTPKG